MTQTMLTDYEPAVSTPDRHESSRRDPSPFVTGDRVCDVHDPDSAAVVLDGSVGRADEVAIDGTGLTIAEYPTNGEYPPDDPVVQIVYEAWLERYTPGWREQAREALPEWLDGFVDQWKIPLQVYDFPASRLRSLNRNP